MDFVAVGHVTLDRTPSGTRPGGAAYYAALTAHRLGLRTALLTSFGPGVPADALPHDLVVVNVPSERTTTFELAEAARGRQLTVLSRAADLESDRQTLDSVRRLAAMTTDQRRQWYSDTPSGQASVTQGPDEIGPLVDQLDMFPPEERADLEQLMRQLSGLSPEEQVRRALEMRARKDRDKEE